MTAMPGPTGRTLSLVCDGCGHAIEDIESPIMFWPVVWAVVSRSGWTGLPVPMGPHRCPQCSQPSPPPAEDTDIAAHVPAVDGGSVPPRTGSSGGAGRRHRAECRSETSMSRTGPTGRADRTNRAGRPARRVRVSTVRQRLTG